MYSDSNNITGAKILEVKKKGLCMRLGILFAHLVHSYIETHKENKAFNTL